MLIVDDPGPVPWEWVREHVLETTEIGWTLKSLDRIWLVATVEDGDNAWAQEYPEYIGNPLYYQVDGSASYEIWDKAACFFSRRAAQLFIDAMPDQYRGYWHTLNYGDESRFENGYLDGLYSWDSSDCRPKFRGSDAWFALRTEVWKRVEENRRLTGRTHG